MRQFAALYDPPWVVEKLQRAWIVSSAIERRVDESHMPAVMSLNFALQRG
ncbi:MAG: hypothetical protein ABFS37_08825 [Acidobacteriota bacterium]